MREWHRPVRGQCMGVSWVSMDVEAQARVAPALASAFTAGRSGLLQRKYTFDGMPGLEDECADCRRKRLSVQRRATNQAGPTTVPPIVKEVPRSPGQPHVHGILLWPSSRHIACVFRKDCTR